MRKGLLLCILLAAGMVCHATLKETRDKIGKVNYQLNRLFSSREYLALEKKLFLSNEEYSKLKKTEGECNDKAFDMMLDNAVKNVENGADLLKKYKELQEKVKTSKGAERTEAGKEANATLAELKKSAYSKREWARGPEYTELQKTKNEAIAKKREMALEMAAKSEDEDAKKFIQSHKELTEERAKLQEELAAKIAGPKEEPKKEEPKKPE